MKSGFPFFPKSGLILTAILFLILLSSCSAGQPTGEVLTTPAVGRNIVAPILVAQVTFAVTVPAKTPGGTLSIDILDEVTGLALNPTRYKMESKGNNLYSLTIPFPVGSLVKYRYGRDTNPPLIEYTPGGKQVHYRMLQVNASQVVSDQVSAWTDAPYNGKFGRITGQIIDAQTRSPLPNILVIAGGIQTLTAADGNYSIENVPTGLQNLVVSSLDGRYEAYQQGAQVTAGLTTPAPIEMVAAHFVNVTFVASVPEGSMKGIPIRVMGNILSLGNSFADLSGGESTLAARAPFMSLRSDGRYSLTLSLPTGLDLRYKYSAGDGFWNAEHVKDGSFRVRQLIVPDADMTVDDSIESWQTQDMAPVTFTVSVPANTPASDAISIQFNPFGWTEPIPMWPLGNRQWIYVLYSPLQLVNNMSYRYCRNDQCGLADDSITQGADSPGRKVSPKATAQTIKDEVTQWAWYQPSSTPTTVVAASILPRDTNFFAGVELQPKYRPSWQAYVALGFDRIQQMGANWVVLDPTWTATELDPPVIEPVTGKDAYWQDLIQMIVWAQDKGLNIGLYPHIDYGSAPEQWWAAAPRNSNWWQAWFDRTRTFILNYADLAAQVNAGILILDDSSLAYGAKITPPADADAQWRGLIKEVRSRYKGKIAWSLPYTAGLKNVPSLVDSVDELYLNWSAPLSKTGAAQPAELAVEMGKLLDQDVLKLREKIKKPILLAFSYPAVKGASKGCIQVGSQCLSGDSINAETLPANIVPDPQEQAVVYDAILTAVNSRGWVDGVVSRGFYPAVTLQDASPSVFGKPASDVLWYWFPRMLGTTK